MNVNDHCIPLQMRPELRLAFRQLDLEVGPIQTPTRGLWMFMVPYEV